jgi:hypothetical protein
MSIIKMPQEFRRMYARARVYPTRVAACQMDACACKAVDKFSGAGEDALKLRKMESVCVV